MSRCAGGRDPPKVKYVSFYPPHPPLKILKGGRSFYSCSSHLCPFPIFLSCPQATGISVASKYSAAPWE